MEMGDEFTHRLAEGLLLFLVGATVAADHHLVDVDHADGDPGGRGAVSI